MKKIVVGLGGIACAAFVATAVAQTPVAHPVLGAWGVDLTSMDKSVKPGDDFFMFVNGAWYKSAAIPPDRTRTGSFDDLIVLSEKRMRELVADIEAKPVAQLTDEEKKLRDLFDAYTDTAAIEAGGLKPAERDLHYYATLKTRADIARAMGTQGRGATSIFATRVVPDAKDPRIFDMNVAQAGLGMPDRDYYLRDDKNLAADRDAYRTHLATMLGLIGAKDAAKRADAVFAFETEIAKAHWAAADRRDADKTYNPMTIGQLASFAPGFAWDEFFKAEGLSPKGPGGDRTVVVRENTAFPAMAQVFAAAPVPVLRDYLAVHYLDNFAAYLPKAFDDANFEFYGKTLNGQAQQLPRDTRGVRLLDRVLGHPLGKLYVAKYFPPESKAKVEELVGNILKAYDADIRTLSWMTEATRQKALDKLHAFVPHVGYPDKWRDFSGLAISRSDLIGDVERSDLFEWHYRLDRIDQPVDRNEWNMTPPTVNAYYTPNFNSIFFPAAILQPPFFDPNADDAVNYGGIGAVIGHEISHGFDDQGSKYDGTGALRSWWTEEDRKNFEERTAMLGKQYSSYEALPGFFVNGKLTMGENIGDNSGISIAYKAYHIALGDKDAPVLDGYTGDQRFFLSYGQIWREKQRDGAMRAQVLANPHSPAHFRADGTTRNQDAWYTAFDVKPGDKYYLAPDQRVHMW
jgi:putative endopeptidase